MDSRKITITNYEYQNIMASFNEHMLIVDSLINGNKIKTINHNKIFAYYPENKPTDNIPMSDEDYSEYLKMRKHPNVPKLSNSIFVDYSKSVNWNLKGAIRYNNEVEKRQKEKYLRMLKLEINNREKKNEIKREIINTFKALFNKLYIHVDNNDIYNIQISLSKYEKITLDDYIYFILNTSDLSPKKIMHNKTYLFRAARTIIYNYQKATKENKICQNTSKKLI